MSTQSAPVPLLFCLDAHPLQATLCAGLCAETGLVETRKFPDGESWLRIGSEVAGRQCIILANLVDPDASYLPLCFLSATLRELQAYSVGLVAPYLCYMRQDKRFVTGEAVTSRIFAQLLSQQADWLVTVDPHLHRYHALSEIYSIPTRVVQAAPALAHWLQTQTNLLLVGPDAESEQWVAAIAQHSGHPYVVGTKQRLGDRKVVVTLPKLTAYQHCTAVILDDVIASGHTVLQCMQALQARGIERISCGCIHGIFADAIDQSLLAGGLQQLVSTNTVRHATNQLDVAGLLVPAIREFLPKAPTQV